MSDQLESNYDCANASSDLPRLLQQLEEMKSSENSQEELNHLENQIHFIRNKCEIPPF